jgi:hypothetical protein
MVTRTCTAFLRAAGSTPMASNVTTYCWRKTCAVSWYSAVSPSGVGRRGTGRTAAARQPGTLVDAIAQPDAREDGRAGFHRGECGLGIDVAGLEVLAVGKEHDRRGGGARCPPGGRSPGRLRRGLCSTRHEAVYGRISAALSPVKPDDGWRCVGERDDGRLVRRAELGNQGAPGGGGVCQRRPAMLLLPSNVRTTACQRRITGGLVAPGPPRVGHRWYRQTPPDRPVTGWPEASRTVAVTSSAGQRSAETDVTWRPAAWA